MTTDTKKAPPPINGPKNETAPTLPAKKTKTRSELGAMRLIVSVLEALPPAARSRIIAYLSSYFTAAPENVTRQGCNAPPLG